MLHAHKLIFFRVKIIPNSPPESRDRELNGFYEQILKVYACAERRDEKIKK